MTEPKMWELARYVIPEIMDQWQDVAQHCLYYDVSIVEVIEKGSANDPERCCSELFKDWLNTENGVGPKTWEVLLEQLKKVEYTDKVEEIAMMVAFKK